MYEPISRWKKTHYTCMYMKPLAEKKDFKQQACRNKKSLIKMMCVLLHISLIQTFYKLPEMPLYESSNLTCSVRKYQRQLDKVDAPTSH